MVIIFSFMNNLTALLYYNILLLMIINNMDSIKQTNKAKTDPKLLRTNWWLSEGKMWGMGKMGEGEKAVRLPFME